MGPTSQHTADERKERKRLQNRINQRARRQRLRDQNGTHNQRGPYQVNRWRLDESPALPEPTPKAPDTSSRDHATKSISDHADGQTLLSQAPNIHQAPNQVSLTSSKCCPRISMPIDHVLLPLIGYNVCRGILSNKDLLKLLGSFISPMAETLPRQITSECEISVFRQTHESMPACLQPTQLQMNLPHPTWIDALPFPKIRDNLLRRQNLFHHRQFLSDLVGYLTYAPITVSQGVPVVDETDDIRNGLILWGEPSSQENWEVSPEFLIKWAWAVVGCEELVQSSNRWRTVRGEDPLDMSLVGYR
ncbi:Hypothetical protein NCS54_01402100 [Fusarium falciforme]|uniref:Hypothetical protein n=1 Tax=Fusarium falciforme TaxID=195108 RepID=UPI002301C750|nr:Hypothetical protein NCS54_01402100 [Fusarium falciforme]WAO96350.1 Hypothetical protein NCS54_01402100 [Fusarium falciforme]